MLPVHTILHPTDFSEQSFNAFRLACVLARDHDARLILLHVATRPVIMYGEGIVPPNLDEHIQEGRDRLSFLDPEDVRTERRLEEGDAVAEILRVAEEEPCDMIVMGTHGRTGLARLLMGSVAEQVVRRAVCPVLTVKTPFPVEEYVPAAREVERESLSTLPLAA